MSFDWSAEEVMFDDESGVDAEKLVELLNGLRSRVEALEAQLKVGQLAEVDKP